MNRIDKLLEKFKSSKIKPILSYVHFSGSLSEVVDTAEFYLESGVDYLEIGIPSTIYPWLDGLTLQSITKEAVRKGITTDQCFVVASLIREKYPEIPLIPMTNYSTVYSYGVERFCEKCSAIDMDGIIVPNYPAYFANDPHNFKKCLDEKGIYFINFINGLILAPEGSKEHELAKKMVESSKGFIYMPSYAGVTGGKGPLPIDQIKQRINHVRKIEEEVGVKTPILVGFGISQPEQVKKIVEAGADSICISSSIIRETKKGKEYLKQYIKSLKEAPRR